MFLRDRVIFDRQAKPLERDAIDGPLRMFGIFPQVTCHLGLDHARADGIGADIGAKIKAKTFGEHRQPRLARRIARRPSHWHQRAR